MPSRAPELGYECRPGGSCPECNPKPIYCQTCLERPVENAQDLCDVCARDRAEEAAIDASTPSERAGWMADAVAADAA